MNSFYKKIEELPETPEEFFSKDGFSRTSEKVTTQDLEDRLFELRLAFKKYPDSGEKILLMSKHLKLGIAKYERNNGNNEID